MLCESCNEVHNRWRGEVDKNNPTQCGDGGLSVDTCDWWMRGCRQMVVSLHPTHHTWCGALFGSATLPGITGSSLGGSPQLQYVSCQLDASCWMHAMPPQAVQPFLSFMPSWWYRTMPAWQNRPSSSFHKRSFKSHLPTVARMWSFRWTSIGIQWIHTFSTDQMCLPLIQAIEFMASVAYIQVCTEGVTDGQKV